jgi:hypothetical protein
MVYTFISAFIYSGFLLYNVIIISNEVKKIALLKNNTTMGKIENMTLFQINKSYDFFYNEYFFNDLYYNYNNDPELFIPLFMKDNGNIA